MQGESFWHSNLYEVASKFDARNCRQKQFEVCRINLADSTSQLSLSLNAKAFRIGCYRIGHYVRLVAAEHFSDLVVCDAMKKFFPRAATPTRCTVRGFPMVAEVVIVCWSVRSGHR